MNASEFLISKGVSEISVSKYTLLNKPFDAVKVSGRDFEKAQEILKNNSFHVFAIEGNRFIYTNIVSNRNGNSLPRFIWLNLGDGVKAGWARTRMNERSWVKFKRSRSGDLSKEALQGII